VSAERTKVAMIGSRGIPGERGGVERVVEAVAPRLVSRGFDVRVYCARWLEYEGRTFAGVELRRVGGIRSKYGDTFTRSLLASIAEARSDSDVVHYHGIGSALFGLIPRAFGKRVVVTVHGLDWRREKWNAVGRTFLRLSEWATPRVAHETVVVGEAIGRYFERTYGRRVRFIPNGAEVRARRPAQRLLERGLEPDRYVLYLGRLVPEKGIHLLIEAFRSLPGAEHLELAIAGPSWYEESYGERLRELAAGDDRIVFLGEVDEEELEELYSNCLVYVLPSSVEGMSLSLLDALAYGCCIVASSIEANADLLGGAGAVFEAGDADDLRRALAEVIGDEELITSYRGAALRRATGDFDWDRITDTWAAVYHEVLGGGPPTTTPEGSSCRRC
jgi:glycosyltransferase involved in cell wall biosynthesis